MSLNKHIGPGLALYQGERVLLNNDGIELTFKKFSHSCEHLKGTKRGQVYLTNFRLIFVSAKKSDMLHELSMPFPQIKDFDIKQPIFGANYLQGKLVAERNGGWEGSGTFVMTFSNGGAIDIGQKLVKLATKPLRMMYDQPATIIVYPSCGVQGYAVPGTSTAYSFPAPNAPPMYSGQPNPPAYPQGATYSNGLNLSDSKAVEAAQSSLPPQYSAEQPPPPKYDEIDRKRQ